MRQTSKRTVRYARSLRKALSLPEALLWHELRRRAGELKFRRQHPAGPFVLDFYCPSAKMAIEIDGIVHDMGDRPQRDALRDTFLALRGIGVVRIPAADVLASPVRAAEMVVSACRDRRK